MYCFRKRIMQHYWYIQILIYLNYQTNNFEVTLLIFSVGDNLGFYINTIKPIVIYKKEFFFFL